MSQLDFLLALQESRSPLLTVVMGGATMLGSEYSFLAVIPVLYWLGNHRWGFRLLAVVMVNFWLNHMLKGVFGTERPFVAHPKEITPLLKWTAGGFAFPSGHAESAVVFWGFLAWHYRRGWLWLVSPAAIILICLSRLYLGLHWPVDIAGGAAIGLGLLVAALVLWHALDYYGARLGPGWGTLAALVGPLALAAAGGFAIQAMKIAGVLWGAGLGEVWRTERLVSREALTARQRSDSARRGPPGAPTRVAVERGERWKFALLGLVGLGVLYLLPKVLLPESEGVLMVRYALLGAWMTWVIPQWLFRHAAAREAATRPKEEDT